MFKELKCKTCKPPERYPGCHDKCSEYIKWKKEREKFLKENPSKYNTNYYLSSKIK